MPCIRVCKGNPVPLEVPHCDPCPEPSYGSPEVLRKSWEEWDLRIVILYILYTQLFLYFFGRRRRKSVPSTIFNSFVWLLYLLSELLATIALGKLSNVDCPDCPDKKKQEIKIVRSLWAPIVLFYLGGPDTITVLHLEENHMWLRHLIGLCAQGFRTSYVLYLTWDTTFKISYLALLMLISGLIKYGERVWVIRSRVQGKRQDFVRLPLDQAQYTTGNYSTTSSDNVVTVTDDAKLVFRAYSYYQTLKPHDASYNCDKDTLEKLVKGFREWVNGKSKKVEDDDAPKKFLRAFNLMEIELGFTYDFCFSKVTTIFTEWGCILRFLTFSSIVSVLVLFLKLEKPNGCLKADIPITIILLLGAIFLDIGGAWVQIASDWAVVWAFKPPLSAKKPSNQESEPQFEVPSHENPSSSKLLMSKKPSDSQSEVQNDNPSNQQSELFLTRPLSKQPSESQCELQSETPSKHLSDPLPGRKHLSKQQSEPLPRKHLSDSQCELLGDNQSNGQQRKPLPSKQPSEPLGRELPTREPKGEQPSKHPTKLLSKPPSDQTNHPSDQLLVNSLGEPPILHPSRLVTPIFHLHERLISKRPRWCERMGQFELLDYWIREGKTIRFENIFKSICDEEKMLKWKFGSQSQVQECLKEKVINQIQEMSENIGLNIESLQTSATKRGGWTLEHYKICLDPSKWSIDREFNESIVIWHLATNIFLDREDESRKTDREVKVTNLLSRYMVYLLYTCSSRFPICNANDKSKTDIDGAKKFFQKPWKTPLLEYEKWEPADSIIVQRVQDLLSSLENNVNRWMIMRSVWVEMMFHAANYCPVKNHVQELRNGGELLTHVWLLLMHFGMAKKRGGSESGPNLGEIGSEGIKQFSENASQSLN